MIDGGSVSSQYFDVASITPSIDAIQEFSVQSNSFVANQTPRLAQLLQYVLRPAGRQTEPTYYLPFYPESNTGTGTLAFAPAAAT